MQIVLLPYKHTCGTVHKEHIISTLSPVCVYAFVYVFEFVYTKRKQVTRNIILSLGTRIFRKIRNSIFIFPYTLG